jgi:hypothetical protein
VSRITNVCFLYANTRGEFANQISNQQPNTAWHGVSQTRIIAREKPNRSGHPGQTDLTEMNDCCVAWVRFARRAATEKDPMKKYTMKLPSLPRLRAIPRLSLGTD